jgi:hypothetical protein
MFHVPFISVSGVHFLGARGGDGIVSENLGQLAKVLSSEE